MTTAVVIQPGPLNPVVVIVGIVESIVIVAVIVAVIVRQCRKNKED